jgi:ABC-type glycerol-3-phosphate transport system substrate-binding protein
MRYRTTVGLLLVTSTALAVSACSTSKDTSSSNGKVTITVNGRPPASDAVNRKKFDDDLAEFTKAHPNITIDAHEGFMDPQTFATKLAGGQLEDAFYVYYTDPAGLIAKRQVADITPYLADFPATKQVRPELTKVFTDSAGKVYGLPYTNYSMGLLYNRTLFTKAGLDPDHPPTTWDGVRDAAKKIAALGNGTIGYGDYSKSNTGGWHFTAETYSLGGEIAVKDGGGWKAGFNNDTGKKVLQTLKDMRWTDNSMGSRQLLEWADLLQLMGSGKLGMYIATSDNIPTIVNQYKGNYADYGLGPMPGGQGTLFGGDGFMFNAKNTPAKIKAAMQWLTFRYENPDRIEFEKKRSADLKEPVGLPEPNIWTGDAAQKLTAATAQYANVPQKNYQPFVAGNGNIPLRLEPPNAQQIYAVLDTAMQKVLTDKNADVNALLSTADTQVNSVLAAVK